MEHRTGPTEPTGAAGGDAAVWEQPLPWLRESDPEAAAPEASAATPTTPTTDEPEPANSPVGEPDSANTPAGEPESTSVLTPAPGPETAHSAEPLQPQPDPESVSSPEAGPEPSQEPELEPEPEPEPGPEPGAASSPAPGAGEPGRLSRLLTTRATASVTAPGAPDADPAQPERGARLIGAVAAASVLAALGLGTVAFMALPGGDDSEPSAAHVEDAAVPTVGPDGSVRPPGSASPSPSARGHRTGDKPGRKPHVGEGGATVGDGGTSSAGKGPDPAHAPAAHDGKTVDVASTHKAGTKTANTHQAESRPESKPAANTAVKPAGDMIVGYASSRCVGVSAHKGSDGSPLTLQGCGGDAWQKWVFASDGSVRSMGMCIDIADASTSSGSGIQLARCNGGWAQKFNLNSSHDLVNTAIGKCVDAKNSGTAAGTRLQLWECGGTSNQKWHLG